MFTRAPQGEPSSHAVLTEENRHQSRNDDHDQVVHAATAYVAAANMDATYGAYVAAENNTFNNTDNRNNDANKNNHANCCSNKNIFGQ